MRPSLQNSMLRYRYTEKATTEHRQGAPKFILLVPGVRLMILAPWQLAATDAVKSNLGEQ